MVFILFLLGKAKLIEGATDNRSEYSGFCLIVVIDVGFGCDVATMPRMVNTVST